MTKNKQIEEIYGFECSEGFISDVTDKILQEIDDWQSRRLIYGDPADWNATTTERSEK